MYVQDNNDTFPGIASGMYGYHPEDWIYWRTTAALCPPFEKSPILTSVPGMQKPSLRCPLDISDAERLAQADPVNGPYLFSYSFNGYGLDGGRINLGMSTVIDSSGGSPAAYPFKEGGVRNPSSKIMLAEEPGSSSGKDSPDGSIVNDGRWVPGTAAGLQGDPLTIRHGGKADVAFADGHVEAVTPDFGADENNNLSSK
jgi:prepilin-type processing-associated H-X9-DG protein